MPAALGAAEAARRIASGELTSEALVAACLERIDAREETVRAWAHLDRDAALEAARRLDRSEPRGPLHGVAVGVKDIIDTADLPTECGTPVHAGRRPGRDADCVAALRAAGAVVLGKTVTTELALYHPSRTRNPADPSRTPGGSSSGSAAAVADGMVPLALGTQTAGSVIRPAAFCGVLGFKPTRGVLSLAGVKQLSERLDTLGLFARAVEDLRRGRRRSAARRRSRCAARRGGTGPTATRRPRSSPPRSGSTRPARRCARCRCRARSTDWSRPRTRCRRTTARAASRASAPSTATS
jgi:Asp-tRNA(Asn)/Glu-tRNA(Gln) amidotransferase A subunit family amidase